MITYKIRLEMTGGREQYTNMEFTTGDVQAYRLEFDFMDNGKAYDCTGHTLTVKAKRSDGSVVVDSGTVEDGKAFYVPANSVFSKPDALELEVALVTADGSYATVKVIHAHVREGFGDGDVTPEDTTPILVSLIAQGEYAKQMGDYAKEQGEWVSEASGAHINDNVRHITAEERAGWNNKVDKTEGKGLSANDYTDEEKAKLAGVQEGAQANVNGYGAVYIDGSFDFGASYPNDSIGFNSGDNVQLVSEWDPLNSSYALKISATDTTYENATDITSGLMSSADKAKLNGIETGAEKNVVKSVAGKTGVVVLDKSDVGLGNLTNDKQAKETDFNAHDGDNVRHITAAERTGWNGKVSQTELSNGLALKADKADFDAHDADEERHITPQERARWDASAIVGDASGEKIVLDDVAPQGAIRELEIYGKSEQETSVQGKNLLDTTGIDRTYKGMEYAHQTDGGVKVTGTTTETFSTSAQIDITSRLTQGKTYVTSITGSTAALYFVTSITRKDGTSSNANPFTMDDTIASVKVYLQINDAGVTLDRTVYLQVEEGSVATAYEPFVPNKPSPEYPSEIKSAENFNALFLRGKNLLDTTGIDRTYNGITCARRNDGGVRVTGTSTGFATSTQIDITPRLKKGKTYVKSWTGSAAGLSFVIALKPKDGAVQYPTTFTFNDTVDTVKAYLQIGSAGVTLDTTVYLQIEEGSAATAYEPYGGTVVNIPYELRGVPNTTGGWLARDYIEVKDGAVKLVRECKEEAFIGLETWYTYKDTQAAEDMHYIIRPDGKKLSYGSADFRWSHYKTTTTGEMPYGKNTSASVFQPSVLYPAGTFESVAAWKTYLAGLAEAGNPLTILYQLATPTVEDITDTETGQALLALTLTAPDAALSNTAESGMAVRYEVDGTIAYKKQLSENKKLASAIVALGGTI